MPYYLLFILLVTLSACTLEPEYKRPSNAAEKLEQFKHKAGDNEGHSTKSMPAAVMQNWWKSLNDPLISKYVEILLNDNLDLKQAAARVEQAQALATAQSGALFPAISGTRSVSRNFRPTSVTASDIGASEVIFNNDRVFSNNWNASLSAVWQLDLFGKIRSQIKGAEANLKALEVDKQAMLHTLVAELAKHRIALAVLKEQLRLTEEAIKARHATLNTVEQRYKLGFDQVSAADVLVAKENLASTKSEVHQLKQAITEKLYAIDLLLGKPPGWSNSQTESIKLLPPPLRIPIGLPADLLDRRPDLQQAEFRLIAANAGIGVALADLYPDYTITGSIGYQSPKPEKLIRATSIAGSIANSVALRIFEGGALRARISVQEAEFKELAASYEQKVLQAIKEVEEALKAEDQLMQQIKYLEQSIDFIKKSEEIAKGRYELGLVSLLELLEIQRRRFSAEKSLLSAMNAKWNARIQLYLALGGDWL